MKTKDVIKSLRINKKISQKELAEKLFVTRQAVSRWENGLSSPNLETLKELSNYFNVSINLLLDSDNKLICQCCGMPLEEIDHVSKEKNGNLNDKFCKWCYTDGEYIYKTFDELMDFLVPHLASFSKKSEDDIRNYLNNSLPNLEYWSDKNAKTNK